MSTKTLLCTALCLLVAASVSAFEVTNTAPNSEVLYRNQPDSNSYTMGQSAGECNPAAPSPIGKIFLVKFSPPDPGKAVLGDGEVSFFSYWSQPGYTFQGDIWEVVSNWTESVSTWNSMIGGTVPYGAYSNILGRKLGTISPPLTFSGGRSTGGTVSGDVIQAWIDNPSANYGLALVNNPANSANWCIRSAWWGANVNPAQNWELVYNLVPEPVLMPILAGLGCLAYRRMR
jgi:hypothetical protein